MIARLTAAAAVLLAVPGTAAAAPVLEELQPCYASAGTEDAQREPVTIRGTGFTPAAVVDILIDGKDVADAQVDVFGALAGAVPAPYRQRGERRFTLLVVERASSTNPSPQRATVTSRVTNLSVSLRPKRARPSRRVRYRGRGFMDDSPVFAHYILNERVRKTVRLARRSRGPCGRFSVKRRQIPIKRPRTGKWLVQIDQQREYAEQPPTNWVHVLINVRREFRDPR
jgi:hypothetical protein